MSKISIKTAQNVNIEYEPALLGQRILAYVIDYIIITICVWGIYFLILQYYFGNLFELGLRPSQVPPFETLIIFWIVFLLPSIFYHLLSEVFMQGQSIGKKIIGIKVIRLNGTQPTIGRYILRWVLRLIDNFLYGIPAITAITYSKNNQRLGDMVAGTTVVRFKKRHKMTLQNVVEESQQDVIKEPRISSSGFIYDPTYPQVTVFNQKDIRIIEETLQNYYRTKDKKMVNKVALRTQEVLKVRGKQQPVLLLETVVKDYKYLNQS